MNANKNKPQPLSAVVTGFAYKTVKDRMPVILTKVIDYFCRMKAPIVSQYGEASSDELKNVIASLSQLKNEMQTNKPLRLFDVTEHTIQHDDTLIWNDCLEKCGVTGAIDDRPKWFVSPWLFVECYMYKAIHHSIVSMQTLQQIDPFMLEKRESLLQARSAITALEQYTRAVWEAVPMMTDSELSDTISAVMQMSVWGNQCDLSLSAGVGVTPASIQDDSNTPVCDDNILSRIKTFLSTMQKNLLVDHSEQIYSHLNKSQSSDKPVALILDNAGYELLTDVCLSLILLRANLTKSVFVYVKTRPWFVSDTMQTDVLYTLEWLRTEGFTWLHDAWKNVIDNDQWVTKEHAFWTTPFSFTDMEEQSPDLYSSLKETKLMIFKGDLNYRKLVADLDWPNDTPFRAAIGSSFTSVAPIVALRTAKGGPVVGVDVAVVQSAENTVGPQWNTCGTCGMIQFTS